MAKKKEKPPAPDFKTSNSAGEQLKNFIERIQRLEEEKATIVKDIQDVYGEVKGTGFDTKIVRKIVQRLKRDPDEVHEEEAVLETYMIALGMWVWDDPDKPDGDGIV